MQNSTMVDLYTYNRQDYYITSRIYQKILLYFYDLYNIQIYNFLRKLFHYLNSHPSEEIFLKLILRTYGGIFENPILINEFSLANKLHSSKKEIINKLTNFHNNGIVDYNYEDSTSKLLFLVNREDDYTINRISKNIEKQHQLKFEKLKSFVDYLQNKNICRNKQLLLYFNEISNSNCGKCDNCLNKNKTEIPFKLVAETILNILIKGSLSSNEIIQALQHSEMDIINTLKILLEKNKITITSQNKFKLTGK